MVFLPSAIILAAYVVLVQEKNKSLSAEEFESLLKNQWILVSMVGGERADREEVFRGISERTGLRVTLISRDGKVVSDSSAGGELEYHGDRPEIKGAFAGRPGMAVRQSDTTGIPTIYYAESLGPGLALRVAYPAEYYQRQEKALFGQTFGGLCALAAAAAAYALLAFRRSGRTMRELGKAVEAARTGEDPAATFGNECLDGALHSLSAATRRLRELDEERAALNRRLEYVLDNISDGVILFRGDDILYSNASAARVLGASVPGSVSGASDPALITLLESLATGAASGQLRTCGKIIAVSVTGEGTGSHGGEGKVAILHDLTDREKYGLYKADLIGNISHELKTPLAVLLAASEVTLKEPGMPEHVRTGFLETIRRNVLRLSAILGDLDYLHRLESVDDAAGAESDLAEAVADGADAAAIEGKTLEREISGGRVALYGPHVTSVVANLVANANRYSTDDLVRLRAVAAGGTVTFEVEDGGPAVPVSERERIFERFYSLSKSRNRDKSGSGLGLSIVKHIAMIYDGEAKALGNSRGGNTFRVTLRERRRLLDGAAGDPKGAVPGGAGVEEMAGAAGSRADAGPDYSGKP